VTVYRLGSQFRCIFQAGESTLDQHLSTSAGVGARYRTPFFSALREYTGRPTGVFYALPISQGKSINKSHRIRDMVDFYGLGVFLAEPLYPENTVTTGWLRCRRCAA
jgi:arginine decarboxylase